MRTGDPMNCSQNRGDNRSAQRIMTVFKAARVASGRADDLGLIRNMSTEGIMVETQLSLHVDDAVVIEIQSGNPIHGRVRWSRDGMTGIQLERPIDLTEALRASSAGIVDKVRPPRFDRVVDVTLQRDGAHWSASTRNVSLSGAQIATDQSLILPKDTLVMLRVDGLGAFGGSVRWQRGKGIGIRFEHPLPLRHFQRWLHQVGAQEPEQAGDRAAAPVAQLRAV